MIITPEIEAKIGSAMLELAIYENIKHRRKTGGLPIRQVFGGQAEKRNRAALGPDHARLHKLAKRRWKVVQSVWRYDGRMLAVMAEVEISYSTLLKDLDWLRGLPNENVHIRGLRG